MSEEKAHRNIAPPSLRKVQAGNSSPAIHKLGAGVQLHSMPTSHIFALTALVASNPTEHPRARQCHTSQRVRKAGGMSHWHFVTYRRLEPPEAMVTGEP